MGLTANPIDPNFLGDHAPHRLSPKPLSFNELVSRYPKLSAVLVVAGLLAASSESGPFPDDEGFEIGYVPREYVFPFRTTEVVEHAPATSSEPSDLLHNFPQFLQRAEHELASVRVEQNMRDDVYHDFVQTLARLYALEEAVHSGMITADQAQTIITGPQRVICVGGANLAFGTYPTPQNRPRHINIQIGEEEHLAVGLQTPF